MKNFHDVFFISANWHLSNILFSSFCSVFSLNFIHYLCTRKKQHPEESYLMEQFEKDSFDELVDRFKRMLHDNKSSFFDSEEMEIIIEDLLFNFEFDICDKAIEHAISSFPQQSIFHILKAKKYRIEIEFEKAESELKIVEKNFPLTAEYYKEKYILQSIIDNNPDNFRLLLRADKMDPSDPEIKFLLSFEFLRLDDIQKAIDCMVFAIQEEEEYAERLFHFSYYFEHHAKFDDSFHFYSILVEKFPLLKGVWFGLGLSYSWLSNHQEAINAYKFALSLDSDIPTAYFNIGNSYYDMGDFNNAIEYYKISLELDPTDTNTIAFLGDCYYKLGQLEIAQEYYQEALSINPENLDALFGMINLTYRGNNVTATCNYIKKAIQITPDNFDHYFLYPSIFDEKLFDKKIVEIFEYGLSLVEDKALHFEKFAIYCCEYDHLEDGLLIIKHYKKNKDIQPKIDYYLAAFYFLIFQYENGNKHLCKALIANSNDYQDFLNLSHKLSKIPDIINLIELFRT